MPDASPEFVARLPLALLGVALLSLYLAIRTVLKWVGRGCEGMVLVFATAAISIVAAALGRADLASHLPLAVASTTITLGVAFILWRTPISTTHHDALILPVALTCAAGFSMGRGDLLACIAVLCVGIAVFRLVPRTTFRLTGPGLLLLSVAGVAGGVLSLVAPGIDRWFGHSSDGIVVSFLLAPVIVLPVVLECVDATRQDDPGPLRPLIHACIACATVLPMAVSLVLMMGGIGSIGSPALSSATRVDATVLFFGSLIVAGLAMGVLRPGRLEAVALLVVYGAGLGAVLLLTHS